jgi:hypothetical protein
MSILAHWTFLDDTYRRNHNPLTLACKEAEAGLKGGVLHSFTHAQCGRKRTTVLR